ncbi:MAG: acetyl-CoA acetyltransferase [Acidimicrobiales bacterium]
MSELDPRTPVVVGVGQVTVRDGGADLDRTALVMMTEAVEAAGHDAGTLALLAQAQLWIASAGVFGYRDPARDVAERFGAEAPRCLLTNFGGNQPQAAVAYVSSQIQAGALDVGVVLGGEAERNRRLVAATGDHLDSRGDERERAPKFGSESPIPGTLELEVGAGAPVVAYALFESALRARHGETLPENEAILSSLWAEFSDVAVDNPFAWNRARVDAAAIGTPTAQNRMVSYPYTKAMCANPQVDMSAAVVVCSIERARALGVPPEKWVFPHSSATGFDTVELLHRDDLARPQAIAPVAAAALAHAGISADDITEVDLYACFPSIVRITAEALDLAVDRPLTVTGGLNFGGGPLNNATLHAVAAMVERLRGNDGTYGLVHGNGGVATKHSIGIYGPNPAATAFADLDAQPEIDLRSRVPEPDHAGPATIAACTVIHDREGPEAALAVLTTPSGTRCFARSNDEAVMTALAESEYVDQPAQRTAAGELVLD